MATCQTCHRRSNEISEALGLCAACIQDDGEAVRRTAAEAHHRSRRRFGLPESPPRTENGLRCTHCANACKVGDGEIGYCGIQRAVEGQLIGGNSSGAAVTWYRDPLPTNCVADWVCPASTAASCPSFTDTERAEYGYHNLAGFIAGLDPNIPYALLAFHPDFEMRDLPVTSRQQATECFEGARAAGLTRVRIGNVHLLN